MTFVPVFFTVKEMLPAGASVAETWQAESLAVTAIGPPPPCWAAGGWAVLVQPASSRAVPAASRAAPALR
ncbi:hypothetical protein GCM10010472_09180 [Pseudonocardia halophobica]|uniref:Uncharacterized protein n=1 Tax=Pseudonocardia halophobica TaxID=29401 RepID=A0A9W6NZT3_9PSEU|nr:hypothetical protein GCM10017577_63600 [Pseudonocardia halophobica]